MIMIMIMAIIIIRYSHYDYWSSCMCSEWSTN